MTIQLLPAALRNMLLLAAAVVATLISFSTTATPAQAQGQPVFFSAELATPVERQTEIINGVLWRCEGTRCVAPRHTSRPDNVCKRLVRKFGPVSAFAVRAEAFDAAAVTACNDID